MPGFDAPKVLHVIIVVEARLHDYNNVKNWFLLY